MITVFGSINIDLVLSVAHLPAPGETVLCPGYEAVPGGKGANQAVAAARAGAAVRMIGCVGEDAFTELALRDLTAAGVDLSAVRRTASPTACAAVMVDEDGENSIVVASGANLDTAAEQIPQGTLGRGDLLVLQMEVPFAENWRAIELAKSGGAQIMLSVAPAAPVPSKILDLVDFLLVNEIEGRTLAGTVSVEDLGRGELPRFLATRHDCHCVMTLGADGIIAAAPDADYQVPALPLKTIVDTTGAGDAFAGCLAAAFAREIGFDAALRYASVGAGLSCSTLGAQPSFPSAGQIEAALPALE
jgi:ribokinase